MDAVDFAFGDVAAEGVEHFGLDVAFGLFAVDAEAAWADSVGTELVGEPEVGDGLFQSFVPGTDAGVVLEVFQDVAGVEAVGAVFAKADEQIH